MTHTNRLTLALLLSGTAFFAGFKRDAINSSWASWKDTIAPYVDSSKSVEGPATTQSENSGAPGIVSPPQPGVPQQAGSANRPQPGGFGGTPGNDGFKQSVEALGGGVADTPNSTGERNLYFEKLSDQLKQFKQPGQPGYQDVPPPPPPTEIDEDFEEEDDGEIVDEDGEDFEELDEEEEDELADESDEDLEVQEFDEAALNQAVQ